MDGNPHTRVSGTCIIADRSFRTALQTNRKTEKEFPSKHAIKCTPLGDEEKKAFLSLHKSILHATKLGYPKEDKVLCLYTGASHKYWSGVVTKISEEQLQFALEEQQQHEPLGFI